MPNRPRRCQTTHSYQHPLNWPAFVQTPLGTAAKKQLMGPGHVQTPLRTKKNKPTCVFLQSPPTKQRLLQPNKSQSRGQNKSREQGEKSHLSPAAGPQASPPRRSLWWRSPRLGCSGVRAGPKPPWISRRGNPAVLFLSCFSFFLFGVLFHLVFSPTAESFGVSAQIGSGVVWGGPEVSPKFHQRRVPPRFCEGCGVV